MIAKAIHLWDLHLNYIMNFDRGHLEIDPLAQNHASFSIAYIKMSFF